jgi:hypothetical protein
MKFPLPSGGGSGEGGSFILEINPFVLIKLSQKGISSLDSNGKTLIAYIYANID